VKTYELQWKSAHYSVKFLTTVTSIYSTADNETSFQLGSASSVERPALLVQVNPFKKLAHASKSVSKVYSFK
jgi:hypothetical protein